MDKGAKCNPLFIKSDLLAKKVYEVSQNFPRNEMFGLTSQLRRAGLSVILNIIEGFARNTDKEFRRFLWIAFGSLKETKYLLYFAWYQKYLTKKDYQEVLNLSEEIAKIIWSIVGKKIIINCLLIVSC